MTTHAATTILERADARVLNASIRADRPAWPGRHRCDDNAVEYGGSPTPSGRLVITTACELCGRILDTVTDSVL